MLTAAKTMTELLAKLPADRKKEFTAVRKMVRAHMPKGYKEVFRLGMLMWEIPLAKYPDTYNGQPLCYAALCVQKHHLSLYLMGAYGDPREMTAIKAAFKAEGKRIDIGKSCIRFRRAEDIPLEALGASIARIPPGKYIARYEELKPRKKR